MMKHIELKISLDTINRVIKERNGIIDDELVLKGIEAVKPPLEKTKIGKLPNLARTRVDSVILNDAMFKTNWKSILIRMIVEMGEHDKTIDFKQITGLKIIRGEERKRGYTYLENAGVSIPSLNIQNCVEAIIKLANHFGYKGRIDYHWRDVPEASRPGKSDMIIL